MGGLLKSAVVGSVTLLLHMVCAVGSLGMVSPFLPNQDKTLGIQLPDVRLLNDDGTPFRLSELKGKPLLISPVFATCKMTCGPMTHNLKSALPVDWKLGSDYNILTLTFDPADDFEVMRALREQHSLPKEWKLAVGDTEEIRKLLEALDFRYMTMDQDGFSHSNFIAAVDKDQRIRYYLLGTDRNPAEITRALEAAQGTSKWKEIARVAFFFFSLAGLIVSAVVVARLLSKRGSQINRKSPPSLSA
jgi:protein SCO1/2